MVRVHGVALSLPAFTRFCMAIGPGIVTSFALAATAYCCWVWFKKADPGRSWVGFLATATSLLFLLTLPVAVALYLPVVNALQNIPAQ